MKILAVIPARGGSKGIPRKNARLMAGKPLIVYSIENARSCDLITDIIVTTDDEEIKSIAEASAIEYIKRENDLAGDNITLDPVVYDAVCKFEDLKGIKYDVIITMQPTSPLLKTRTLRDAIQSYLDKSFDTSISVVNKPHLAWSKNSNGYYPVYKERLNRQQLPPNYMETGAFFITKREFVKPDSRMGYTISVYEVPEEEAVDVDSVSDWVICENALRKKRIILRVDGFKELGMGHIYHCLTLAYNLTGHEVMFVTKKIYQEGVNMIKHSFMPFTLISDEEEFFEFIQNWKPDIVVNDCLDTNVSYMKRLKSIAERVVTIEDLGEGAKYADVIINALYNKKHQSNNYYFGERYICLRDEFLISRPKKFSSTVKDVLVMFGGTDPSNLTKKIYEIAIELNKNYPDITFTIITGSGFDAEKNGIVSIELKRIRVLNNVKRVSDYMRNADLAFTSQGRTVFELASLGVPSIVLAQNEREQLHTFAQMQNGFLNLGLGQDISSETIAATFKWLVETEQIRYEMRQLMLRHDLKRGLKRVIDVILEEN